MSRRSVVTFAVGSAATLVACAVALRTTPDAGRCSRGFVAKGSSCVLATPCPSPFVSATSGCESPRRRIAIVGGVLALSGTDWEAEGRVHAADERIADFELDAYEITRGEFEKAPPKEATDRLRAASNVTREEARAFCKGKGGRLPTLSEWTFAAAGPRGRRYPWGDTGAVCKRGAWGLEHGPCANGATGPDPVGSHEEGVSELGLHDMAGNVAEWVDAKEGLVIGGSYRTALATDLRTWRREPAGPETRSPHIGFRCAYDAGHGEGVQNDAGTARPEGVREEHARGVLSFFPLVEGDALSDASLDGKPARPFSDLVTTKLDKGPHTLTFQVTISEDRQISLPICAGRSRYLLDGAESKLESPYPAILEVKKGAHTLILPFDVGSYEARIACASPLHIGRRSDAPHGFARLTFPSPEAKGGEALVYLPKKSAGTPSPLLVSLHPWNGSIVTYAAYASLIRAADAIGMILLFPSGLGNSLYTKAAEEEALRALEVAKNVLPVREDRVSIFGASMGGAGATTIGFHHPDKFVFVGSYFGDSKYDLSTYVRSILKDDKSAHLVNALDYAENGEHLATWLVHGDTDRLSSVKQSDQLAERLKSLGYAVTYHRVPGRGHEGTLVEEYAAELVERAAVTKRKPITHVLYRSVGKDYDRAYGVAFDRKGAGDVVFEIEQAGEEVRVLRLENATNLRLESGSPFHGHVVDARKEVGTSSK